MIINKLALGLTLLLGATGMASADYADAMNHYEQQEYRQALQGFREAAQRGDADAQYMLGRLNEAGNGTTQNFVQAHKWYNLAAARGHRHAADARDALAERMTDRQVAEAQQAASDWQPEETAASERTSQPAVETLSYRERVAEIQHELNRLGYDAGPTDGLMGDRTRSAIYQYQADVGITRDGRASADLLQRLRQAEKDETATDDKPESDSPQVVLQENFSDGDYRRNPRWTVISGEFEVDRNGLHSIVETQRAMDRTGLNSDRPEEIGLAVLGMILEQRTGASQREESRPARPAQIFVDAPTDNAFHMELDIASLQQPGHLEMGLFQGSQPNGTGYRLVYSAGSQPALSLIRVIFGNTETIARYDGQLDLEDERFHRIVWSRDESGQMQVRVDDRPLLQVKDNGLRDPFQGFVMENQGGDYYLRQVRIEN